jgi:predicted aspartyl protease
LYGGRLTYGQFAAERMKTTDQILQSLSGAGAATDSGETMPLSRNGGTTASDTTAEPNPSEQRTEASTQEVPLQREGNSYLVPVSVNALPPMDFLLDTGSNVVALPAEVVLTLWRTGTFQSNDFIGNRTYVLADGSEVPSLTFRIRQLRVGQYVIPNVIGSLNPALTEPLLGGSFLSRFAAWTIDNQRNVLVLR